VRIHGGDKPLAVYNVPRLEDRALPVARRLRELAGAAADEALAVYCGGIAPHRGIEQALAALPLVPHARLALLGFGEPAYLRSLQAESARLGVAHRVCFVPAVRANEVSATLRGADLSLVLIQDAGLNYYLSSPNKLFESVHAGLPVVATRFPEMRSVVERFGCGLLIDAEAPPSAIAQAMGAILRDAPFKRRLAEGAESAARALNWENEERELLRAYVALAGLG
jgi:glycosyltransferase involved in cell wall biosynthesis